MRWKRKAMASILLALWITVLGVQAQNTVAAESTDLSISAAVSKVKTGLVHWHTSFETALQAADESGKPVFLFQLVGNLDEALC